jgi:hypothetical protein
VVEVSAEVGLATASGLQLLGAFLRLVIDGCSVVTPDSEVEGQPLPSASPGSASAFLLLLWPKWCRPWHWCGGRRWIFVEFPEMEEGPSRSQLDAGSFLLNC